MKLTYLDPATVNARRILVELSSGEAFVRDAPADEFGPARTETMLIGPDSVVIHAIPGLRWWDEIVKRSLAIDDYKPVN